MGGVMGIEPHGTWATNYGWNRYLGYQGLHRQVRNAAINQPTLKMAMGEETTGDSYVGYLTSSPDSNPFVHDGIDNFL